MALPKKSLKKGLLKSGLSDLKAGLSDLKSALLGLKLTLQSLILAGLFLVIFLAEPTGLSPHNFTEPDGKTASPAKKQ